MKKSTLLLISACLLGFTACRPTVHEMPKEEVLTRLLRENPDSLANMLEEKINPNMLSDSDKADYAWWLTRTHKRQNRSLMNDTLIHFAVDYYKKTNSSHLLDACLLAAEQINWSDTERLQQKQLLNEALQIAVQKQDTAVIQDICSRLLSFYEMPEDSAPIKELIQFTKKYAGQEWNVGSYLNITLQFSKLNQSDSALFYARKGMELARRQNNPSNDWMEYQLIKSYARTLNTLGKHGESISVLRELENSKLPVGNEIRLEYIITWIDWGKLDSAQIYIDAFRSFTDEVRKQMKTDAGMDIELDNLNVVLGAFQEIIRAKEGKPLFIHEIGASTNNVMSKIRNRMKIDREQQLVQTRLVRNNLTLDVERGKLKQRFLWAGIGVLLLVIFIIYFYQRKLLRKERSVQEAKEQLRLRTIQLAENESLIHRNEELISDLSTQLDETGELKQEINSLVAENDDLKQKNKLLQKDIDRYSKSTDQKDKEVSAYEKLTEQNARLQERERFLTARLVAQTEILAKLSRKPRYIEPSQWPEILHDMNQLFDGFSYRLRTDFPSLTEDDIYYCCLFKLRLSTSVVGILMGISPSSVTKRKQRIKEKMNQQRPDGFLKEQALEIGLWNY
ncbi:MAG: hypothetical protein LBE91_10595 [Tannerella sp.]|jgi:regulator of replication initiation timing|nr:hypothetical protein [Tannerella sp.]